MLRFNLTIRALGNSQRVILKICDNIDDNPKVREEAEMYQEKYGILSEEELRRVITT